MFSRIRLTRTVLSSSSFKVHARKFALTTSYSLDYSSESERRVE